MIEIKTLNNSHCEQIVDIIIPIQQIEFNVAVTLEAQPDLLDIETYYHKTGGNFWGAFYDGRLVGTIGFIAFDGHGAALRKMFVRSEFRGKEMGIAQLLLDTLLAHCKQNRIDDIYLGTVEQLKAAHRFYERNGFTRIEKEDLPVNFPLMSSDTMFYEVHLDN